MAGDYMVALAGVLISLLGAGGFLWALRHRQFRADDREMYAVIADDEPDYGDAAHRRRIPLIGRCVFAGILLAIFAMIGWMTYRTVAIAARTSVSPHHPVNSSRQGR